VSAKVILQYWRKASGLARPTQKAIYPVRLPVLPVFSADRIYPFCNLVNNTAKTAYIIVANPYLDMVLKTYAVNWSVIYNQIIQQPKKPIPFSSGSVSFNVYSGKHRAVQKNNLVWQDVSSEKILLLLNINQ